MYGEEEVNTGFWRGNLRERDNLEDPGIIEKIILKWIIKKWHGGGGGAMDWIDLSQNRDVRQTFVNTVMNHQFP